ncbi:retropepsin-like aspartic protease [Nitrospirillum amazonense]|uniref:retropepsin-like aspartic protease n=1 Tax=Nitrospirillum amazonense TaxID=28077 RepID=UPI00119D5EDB|nr:retropepsin-like aspartic protease [Nitrospirillum amazonense]
MSRWIVPIVMEGNQPLIPGEINGTPVKFLIDTGANDSFILQGAAKRLDLPKGRLRGYAYGVDGKSEINDTIIKTLTLNGGSASDVPMTIAGQGNNLGHPDVVGVLGERFFSHYDVELDFAHSRIVLYTPHNCADANLKTWEGDYSVVAIRRMTSFLPQVILDLQINGAPIQALLDTGAYYSVLTMDAAKRLGVTPDSPEARPVGAANGVNGKQVSTWIGAFDSFSLGDETIRHPKMRFGNLRGGYESFNARDAMTEAGMQMLLGADFLRSHHVLIAHSQHRLYFSYVGGPVFQTDAPPPAATAPVAPAAEHQNE